MPKKTELIINYEDPVDFTEKLLRNRDGSPAKPHAGQIELLRGIEGLTVACCGRQWGKSVALGWYGTWYAVTHSNREVYIIAPTVDQSRIIFNEIAMHFRTAPLSALVEKIKEYPFPQIKLKNGTNINGRGANSPEYIRGKPIHLALCDESAFFKDGVISQVIEPMFTVTGQMKHSGIVLISTPFGLGDFFDYAQRAKKGDGSRFHHFTSLDNPYANKKYLEGIRDEYGEDSLLWRTEYMAEFVDGDLAVFPWSQIKRAIERYPYETFPIASVTGHKYVQGVDLANVRDYFVASVLDVSNPSLVPLVHYDQLQKKGYKHYKQVIRNNYKTYNKAKTIIDATSLGESVVEDLDDIRAEGYKFSNQSKYEIVHELVRMFQENRIAIPNDRKVVDELRFFAYEITKNKTLRMEAKRGHDDIVMSLSLAAHLALIPRSTGFFQSVDGFDPIYRQKHKKPLPKDFDPIAALFSFDEDFDDYLVS
jgi:phage FluMu gp28-like protein